MKKILNFLLLSTVFFVGCRKNDARYPFDVAIVRVPYVNVTPDATSSVSIDLTNLATFQGKFNVNLLYPKDISPEKVDVVIRKNNDNTNVKIVQAGITTFPTGTITITAAQIATLFGAAIKLGDNYDIGTDIYLGGTKYEAFPQGTGVLAYGGTGQANQPGFIPTIRYSALCLYDPNVYQGNFVVVSDDWADYTPGDVIVLTKISNTSFSFTHFAPANAVPFVLTVNTGTNAVTGVRQQVGTSWLYSANPATYPLATMSATGVVAPCDKTVTLDIQYGVNGVASTANFTGGPYRLVLKKQ
ncbi:MAG TPA: hypothetical protein VK498_07630 [Ferruginibacter sp.]|nr:hypothetical protein [Ferruginibacter sp.]